MVPFLATGLSGSLSIPFIDKALLLEEGRSTRGLLLGVSNDSVPLKGLSIGVVRIVKGRFRDIWCFLLTWGSKFCTYLKEDFRLR